MIYKDNYNKDNKVKGQIVAYIHNGGEYKNGTIVGGEIVDKIVIQNLIVDKASELLAARLAPGAIVGTTDPAFQGNYLDRGLQYLALGVGVLSDPNLPYDEKTNPVDATQWDIQNPPEETLSDTKLAGEFYRKRFTSWGFLDPSGADTDTLTNILRITTTFYENEANGPISEMGLYGGDAQDWNAGTGKDSGYLFNHKTFKVINKPSQSRFTIVWKLTF